MPGTGFWVAFVGVWVIGLILLFTVSPIGIFGKYGKLSRERKDLMQHGIPAQAEILAVTDTGGRVASGLDHILKFRLRVDATAGTQAFEGDAVAPIPVIRFPEFAVGHRANVKVNPHTRAIAIDIGSAGR